MWGVHEEPYDFFRYTPFALEMLVEEAGFRMDNLTSHGGRMVCLAQYFTDLGQMVSSSPFRVPSRLAHAIAMFARIGGRAIARLDRYESSHPFTLGYSVRATAVTDRLIGLPSSARMP
jgi:hypothetical protein